MGRLQAVEAVILLLLVGLGAGAAVEAVPLVAGPAGAVEAAQGVGAVSEQRAGPVLALIEVRLLTQLPAPAVVTVALQHDTSDPDSVTQTNPRAPGHATHPHYIPWSKLKYADGGW